MVHVEPSLMRLLAYKVQGRGRPAFFWLVGSVYFLLAGVSCAWSQTHSNYTIGQVFDVGTKQLIALEALKPKLLEAEVIYLGEEHHTPSHIDTALKVLDMLLSAGRKPALAMEMFRWDGQPALDRFGTDQITSEAQLLQEAAWEKNWGGDFKDYQPLVAFSKQHHIPVYALTPPRALVRLVVSKGLNEALGDPSMTQWGIPAHISLDDPEYRRVIFQQITACHPKLPDDAYQRYYEASIFKDEGMAKVIKDYLGGKSAAEGPLVSYTGSGHIQFQIPVPSRVKRNQPPGFKDLSIYLIALDPSRTDEIAQAIDEGIADYVWLTELGPKGPQPRCG